MKLKYKIIGMLTLMFVVFIVGLLLWRPYYVFRVMAEISPDFSVSWMLNWREKMTNNVVEHDSSNHKNKIVRIELEGNLYNIPIEYMYADAFEKFGAWPSLKPERVKVETLSLSLLLPEMKPYHSEDDARWRVKGHGDRLEVDITNSLGSLDWFPSLRDKYVKEGNSLFIQMPNKYTLMHYSNDNLGGRYFPLDLSAELTITCDAKPANNDPDNYFSPSCNVRSNYKTGVVLDYTFGSVYLPRWYEIDKGLKKIFDDFQKDALVEINNKGS